MFEHAPAFLESSPEQKAGFVAHLTMLAGDEAELRPALFTWLVLFLELAELEDELDPEDRQAKVDAFYARWPLSPRLLALLERETESLEEVAARATRRAAESIGAKRSISPVKRHAIVGTFGGGNLGLITVRTGHAVTAPIHQLPNTIGVGAAR